MAFGRSSERLPTSSYFVLSEPYWAEFEETIGLDPLAQGGSDTSSLLPMKGSFTSWGDQVELQNELGVPSELLGAEDLTSTLANPRRAPLRRRQLLRDPTDT